MDPELLYGLANSGTAAFSVDAQPDLWLSLLIPAYEHPTGVLRILNRLHAAGDKGVECLINDDSRSDAVEAAVRNHPLHQAGGVIYRRNRPALGAVSNWNDLLARARGEYLLLMHHDECPENDKFFPLLQSQLTKVNSPDMLLLNCLLPTSDGFRLRCHMPLWIRRVLLAWSPDHLLRHNTQGSPSVMVIRQSHCLLFSPALKWLVDVEWMTRTLRLPGIRVNFSRDLAVISLPHLGTSITASLQGEIPRLRLIEARMIRNHFGTSGVIRLMLPSNWIECAVSGAEQACWLLLRAVIRATDWFTRRKLPSWLQDGL